MSIRAKPIAAADPFLNPPEHRILLLAKRMETIEARQLELHRLIPTAASLQPMLHAAFAAETARLEQLTDDAVRILTLLVSKGLVTQEELNAAVCRG